MSATFKWTWPILTPGSMGGFGAAMSAGPAVEHRSNHDGRDEEAQVGVLPELWARLARLQEDEAGAESQQPQRFELSAGRKAIRRRAQGDDDNEHPGDHSRIIPKLTGQLINERVFRDATGAACAKAR